MQRFVAHEVTERDGGAVGRAAEGVVAVLAVLVALMVGVAVGE